MLKRLVNLDAVEPSKRLDPAYYLIGGYRSLLAGGNQSDTGGCDISGCGTCHGCYHTQDLGFLVLFRNLDMLDLVFAHLKQDAVAASVNEV